MAGKIRYSGKSRSRRKQKEIDRQYGLMAAKKILPAAFLVLYLLAMALLWWCFLNPGRWKTDTIIYTRMSVAEVNLGRTGPKDVNVLISKDGRNFELTDEERAALSGKLSYGEECEIVYSRNPIGMGPEHLERLATAEDGVLISEEASLAEIQQGRKDMGWMIGVPVAVCLIVEVLIERFGCKKKRARIAQLKAEQAKLAAREERQRAYKESKRAGA